MSCGGRDDEAGGGEVGCGHGGNAGGEADLKEVERREFATERLQARKRAHDDGSHRLEDCGEVVEDGEGGARLQF